jgi:very-short-patch-repair endonuclease
VEIKRQFMIGRYRVDFMLGRRRPNGRADCLVVVECDGQAYHGPKEDYPRDRFLQTHGAAVLRFTGSELATIDGSIACAAEVYQWMDAAIRRADR